MFDIYTLGDTQTTADVLNSVAMMFSSSPILKSNGSLGLGIGAFFGAILLFMIMIIKAVFEQKLDTKILIVPLILYIILTVPKTSVVVLDVYNVETPKKVDNIPIGLAMPISVMSGISAVLAKAVEKAIDVIPNNLNSPPTRLTQDGFLTPLQVLNSIRYDNMNINHPLLQGAFNKVYETCLVDNSNWNGNSYFSSKDPLNYFLNSVKNDDTLVSIVVSQGGEAVDKTLTCSDAASYIKLAIDTHISGTGSDLTGLLGANFKKNSLTNQVAKSMAVNNGLGKLRNNSGYIRYSDEDIAQVLDGLIGTSSQQSRAFITSILFDPMVKTASNCLSEMSVGEMAKCTSWISTYEQWKDRSAASGTNFLKKMKDSQNLFTFIGFGLFPFMVFMIMLRGLSSIKMVGGYVAFLLSNYMWMPIAVIINYYGQYSFQDAVYQLSIINPDAFLTLSQAPQLYDALSTKLAIASNAMGMTPILTSMLFGGMMWGMSAFSKAINPTDGGYDASVNSKAITNSTPFKTSSSLILKDGFGATTLSGTGSLDVNAMQSVSFAKTKSKEIDDEISLKMSRLEEIAAKESTQYNTGVVNSTGHRSNSQDGDQVEAQNSRTESTANHTNQDGTSTTSSTAIKTNKLEVQSVQADNAMTRFGVAAGGKIGKVFGDNGGSNAGVGVGINGSAIKAATGNLKVTGTYIDPTKTSEPTGKETTTKTTGIESVNYTESEKVSGSRLTGKIDNTQSNDFKAIKLNEAIQRSNSKSLTVADKQEASDLTREIQGLSYQKMAAVQQAMTNTVTDRDIGGLVNPLTPNSQQVMRSLEATDQLAREKIPNWDDLKQDAMKKLSYGGNIDEQVMQYQAIWLAARQSGNSDVMLSAIDALSPTGSFNDRFRENKTFEQIANAENKGREIENHITPHTKHIPKSIERLDKGISAANFDLNKLPNDIKNPEESSSNGLIKQHIAPVIGFQVTIKDINKEQAHEKIAKKYDQDSSGIEPQFKNESEKLPTKAGQPSVHVNQADKDMTTSALVFDNKAVDQILQAKIDLAEGKTVPIIKLTDKGKD